MIVGELEICMVNRAWAWFSALYFVTAVQNWVLKMYAYVKYVMYLCWRIFHYSIWNVLGPAVYFDWLLDFGCRINSRSAIMTKKGLNLDWHQNTHVKRDIKDLLLSLKTHTYNMQSNKPFTKMWLQFSDFSILLSLPAIFQLLYLSLSASQRHLLMSCTLVSHVITDTQ